MIKKYLSERKTNLSFSRASGWLCLDEKDCPDTIVGTLGTERLMLF